MTKPLPQPAFPADPRYYRTHDLYTAEQLLQYAVQHPVQRVDPLTPQERAVLAAVLFNQEPENDF